MSAESTSNAPIRIFVTGGTGYVGSHFIHSLLSACPAPRVSVLYTYHSHAPLQLPAALPEGVQLEARKVDLREEQQVTSVIAEFKPDVIVHKAAISNTGQCEKYPDLAQAINVTATANVVRAMQALSATGHRCHLLHMSTDWVYTGDRADVDESAEAPGSHAYGRTKRAGEQVVLEQLADSANFTILRSALIYGAPSPLTGKDSFLKFILDGLSSDAGADLFEDEFRSPVAVDYVLHVIRCIIDSVTAKDSSSSSSASASSSASPFRGQVLNMGGLERLSRLDVGRQMAAVLGAPVERARGTTLERAGLAASRPADLSMNSAKLHALTKEKPKKFREHFEDIMKQQQKQQ